MYSSQVRLSMLKLKLFILYHLKMPHGILDSLNLLFRASRLLAVRRLRLIIILPFNNPMLLLDLSDVQIGHPVAVLCFNPIPNRIIGSSLLKSIRIHILQTKLHADLFTLDISLGKTAYRLDVGSAGEHVVDLGALKGVALLCKALQVPRQGCRVAGDIDDPLGLQCGKVGDDALVQAFPGRERQGTVLCLARPRESRSPQDFLLVQFLHPEAATNRSLIHA